VFGITPVTGLFYVLPGQTLDYETTRSYAVDVQVCGVAASMMLGSFSSPFPLSHSAPQSLLFLSCFTCTPHGTTATALFELCHVPAPPPPPSGFPVVADCSAPTCCVVDRAD
jgi:hypothetical protein